MTDGPECWRGCALCELNASLRFPKIVPSPLHSVLVLLPVPSGSIPEPFRSREPDKWDGEHVRMPFSPGNLFPYVQENGIKACRRRWDVIVEALTQQPFGSSQHLEQAMFKYHKRSYDCSGLHQFFASHVDQDEERRFYFDQLFPKMISVLRNSPFMLTSPIPLLRKGVSHSITLSQAQVSALLINAFFCTFPRRNPPSSRRSFTHEYSNYPDINFTRVFNAFEAQYQVEKLKCLFHYFRRVLLDKTPQGLITFSRRCLSLSQIPTWATCSDCTLTKLRLSSEGCIEDATGLLQADFANSYVGGGVLGHGCVQEEIRFITCPELILARLFTERLEDNECLTVIGFERFSKSSGYANTFQFQGRFDDPTPFEGEASYRRRKSYLVAMDALYFSHSRQQYTKANIDRELTKAYVAFYSKDEAGDPVAVASGNWGCGAFGGDPILKFVIQLMACAVCGRDLLYYTFGDVKLRDELHDLYSRFVENNLSVADLYNMIVDYRHHDSAPGNLQSFISERLVPKSGAVATESKRMRVSMITEFFAPEVKKT